MESMYEPPEHLSESSKELWRAIVPRRAKSPERLALLEEALSIRDRLLQIRALIASQDQLVEEGEKMIHLHPLVRAEREWSQAFLRLWKALDLDWWQRIDGVG